jgi:capsular exopolysaccharide synthesis family protein
MAADSITRNDPALREPGLIDLRQIWAEIRRRWLVIAVAVAVVLILTAIAYFRTIPQYTAVAQVALDRRDIELARQDTETEPLTTDSASVDTEVQVLRSPDVAARVVRGLKLGNDPEFAGDQAGTPAGQEAAMRVLLGALEINRTGMSYAIDVGIASPSPIKAAAVANAVADAYVDGIVAGKQNTRRRDVTLLGNRLAQLRGDVMTAEAALARYRADNNLLIVDTDRTASAQELSALNTQLADAQAQQAAAEARLANAQAQIRRGRSGETLGEALNSDVVQQLRTQQAQASAERAALAVRYGDRHPDLAAVDRRVADINQGIAAEVRRIVASLQTEAAVARGRTGSLQSSIGRSQGGLRAENAASVRMAELQRNADSARGLYQAFLDQYRGAVARQGTDRSSAYIIARAIPPTAPTTPNPLVYAALGLIAAGIAAVAAVALLHFLENGVESNDDVERKFGLPTLATVPDIATIPGAKVRFGDSMAPADYLLQEPKSSFAESFRSIRTALKRAPGGENTRIVAVTSALPGEGKTTIAIGLARSAALAGQRALLIDCDMRQRATSRELASQISYGLSDVLSGKAPLETALVRDGGSDTFILPQSPASEGHLELLDSPEMTQLVAQLRERFDLIVLDCAPVLAVAEARQAAVLADQVMMVVRWRKTSARAVSYALDQLFRVNADVAGIVLSRADLRALARSGTGDQAFYHAYEKYYSTT